MLYCNEELVSSPRSFDFGTIHQVSLGEMGRGRRLLALTCPESTIIKNGMNIEYTIGLTKSNRPRIFKQIDRSMLFLLLSTKGSYTRKGNGTIALPTKQVDNFLPIAKGNGADGDAGRIGHWDCALIMVKDLTKKSIIRVQRSGRGYDIPANFLLIDGLNVFNCLEDQLADACEMRNFEFPRMDPSSWITL